MGKFVLITGATHGLGKAMVREFIALGHTVAGCGRSADAIAKLEKEFGKPHSFYTCDVRSDGDVKKWAAQTVKQHGPPDLLLNNAATINRNSPLWKITAEEFDAVVDTNIKGVANVLRHFVPAMIERKHGIIVNFSSGWGRSVDAEVAPYCATKWAIEGLTKALALELPDGMAAVPLNPGVIDTRMLRSCFGGSAAGYPTAEEWARTAVPFLLKVTANVNGESLTVL